MMVDLDYLRYACDTDELIDELIARGNAYMALAESLIDYGDGMRIWPGDEGRGLRC